MYSVEVYQDRSSKREWRWRVSAANGKIVGASSEGFSSKSYAVSNLKALAPTLAKTGSEHGISLDVYTDEQDEWRWKLIAGNGKITHASSEGFRTKTGATNNLNLLAVSASSYESSEDH